MGAGVTNLRPEENKREARFGLVLALFVGARKGSRCIDGLYIAVMWFDWWFVWFCWASMRLMDCEGVRWRGENEISVW
jgi:hypothetical protein